MTDKLTSLLHDRADSVDFARPDLDAIARDGSRHLRRRRATRAVAGLAAAAVVAAGGAVALRSGDSTDRHDLVTVEPLRSDLLTWATGSTLHAPGTERDLGHPIRAYVRTSAGYVFTDGGGRVFSYTGGRVEEVGRIAKRLPRLVSDTEGPLAGWVDPSGDAPAFVVLDQLTGKVRTLDGETGPGMGSVADEEDPAYFYALDGRTAYLRDRRGAVALDLDSESVTVIDAGAANGFDILAVEDGLFAFPGGDPGAVLSRMHEEKGLVLPQVYSSRAVFSPDGRWVSLDADEPQVYDARTGTRVAMDVDGRYFATGYEWVGADTLAMIAARSDAGSVELLSCEVPAGTCTVAVPDLGSFEDLAGAFALPVGESMR